ncbi:MAG: N-acetylmuramoyl-L-alanine amidase [Trueperaceae bacterium]|nr:N-acetylmuramoyl-L-alanine amidase [Trueperaceae bacterium]
MPQEYHSKQRRLIMIVSLSVASLLLLGLTQQPVLPVVPETLSAVKQSVQQTFLPQPPRVGLQIGHLDPEEQPDELASLRYNTGGSAFGVNEVDINRSTAYMLKDMLEFEGIEVDLLPATMPANYHADLVIALHSDASPDVNRRGYKSAYFRYPRNKWEPELKKAIDQAYFFFSGLPDDDENVSGSMLEYYAFNRARYKHAVSRSTPAVIVEMGYISNEQDRDFLLDPVNPAYALKRGILTYLAERGRYTFDDN